MLGLQRILTKDVKQYLLSFFASERAYKFFVFVMILCFSFYGIIIAYQVLMVSMNHISLYLYKTAFIVLSILWLTGFFVFVFNKNTPALVLIFIVYTIFYDNWLDAWNDLFPVQFLHTKILQLEFLSEQAFTIHITFSTFLLLIFFISTVFFILKRESFKEFLSQKYWQEIFIFFLFFSMMFLLTKNIYDPLNMEESHNIILFSDRNYLPNDYRLFVPYIVETSKDFFTTIDFTYLMSIQRLYKLYNMLALVFAFFVYYFFLTKFLKKTAALLTSILLLLLFYISFYVGGRIEDPFNILFFVLGLVLIYYKKDILFWILIIISSFNRETTFFLVFMYFVHNSQWITKKNWWKVVGKTILFAASFFGIIALKLSLKPVHETQVSYFYYNLSCHQCTLHVFLILNIFWILAFFFREVPDELSFFRRLNFITPFFVAWHYLGLIREIRYFIVIGIILLPLGISLLFPESIKTLRDNRIEEVVVSEK